MKPNPHDALVRYTFKNLTHARGLLKSLLPAPLVRQAQWHKLAVVDGSFIDPQLAEKQTDLLYHVPIAGHDAFIYVLLEHQSTPQRMMPFRMLVYLTRIWQRELSEHPELRKLPLIVPLVLHHSAKGWTAPTSMAELYNADQELLQSLGDLLPQMTFQLTDLTHQEDQELHRSLTSSLAKLVLLSLKHAPYDQDLAERLRQWLELFVEIAQSQGGVAALEVVARYMLEVNDITVDAMRNVLKPMLQPGKLEAVMTGAEKLRAEGEAKGRAEGKIEGRAEGKIEGRAEVLSKLLTLKFGALPSDIDARLRNASIEQLDLWAERVLSANTLADIFR